MWDDGVGQPAWAGIRTGRSGTNAFLVPLGNAELHDQGLVVPFSTTTVTQAPKVSALRDEPPSRGDVVCLCRHYRLRQQDISSAYQTDLAVDAAYRPAGRGRRRGGWYVGAGMRTSLAGIFALQ